MTSQQIRQSFLDFFRSKRHTIVPSASLLPDSPNLLFTNAGMNQFVPIFLGQKKPDVSKWAGAISELDTRAADTQKCIRAGGKHNDLEDVGLDTYHHTFFEMLGNWSFGDYFKKDAIAWAWELVTEVWKFPKERLYATVYKPDPTQGDPSEIDQEAWDIWAEKFRAAGLDPQVHIVFGNKKDNFWMMGETGPCGPCSEIHVDLTPQGDTKGSLVNKGSAQCIEIWNLVFIQFNANPDGTFTPLPAKHVDTGMGFERVTAIIQGTKGFKDFIHAKISNYETDIFRPIFDAIEKLSGKKYGSTLPGEHARPRVSQSAPPPIAGEGEHTRPRVSQSAPPPIAGEARGPGEAKYSRRNLPHFERPWAKYMVTFSTRDRRQLSDPERDLTLKSILYPHEHRQYQLYAACVMPDHVHLLFEPQIKEQDKEGNPVFWSWGEILQGIKSASSHNINKASGRKEHIWEKESMDRMIRGQSDLEEKFHYICRNPWDSGVVPLTENYPWLWVPETGAPGRGAVVGAGGGSGVVEGATTVSTPRDSASLLPTAGAQSAAREGACAPHPESDQEKTDVAFRVIADHIRTLGFAIADGIQPGNNDRNYVLRRILRRAVRYGRSLGFHEPFFYKLVDVMAETMGDVFPEIRAKKKHVRETVRAEEEAFNRTLDNGIKRFNQICAALIAKSLTSSGQDLSEYTKGIVSDIRFVKENDGQDFERLVVAATRQVPDWTLSRLGPIPGDFAFELYDTYGFPLDLTELIARERGLTVDVEGFNKLMEEQRARARAAQKKQVVELSQIETTAPTKFVGYDKLETSAKVLEVLSLKDKIAVILDTSACYAEMGGQVGDTGELSHGGQLWRIVNTQKSGNAWLHFTEDQDGPEVEAEVEVTVDRDRRAAIQRHHTVTHLLHWALHEVVSRDATQKGSFVGPDKLTFDFNAQPLTPQQVADIERLVNERILENAGVSWTEVPFADVKSRKDVMQFFGDKYGDVVRVVQIGGGAGELNGYSMELCGGTHTHATGEIGLFRIVGESAIAAGVRRIEALAGLEAYRKAADELHLIKTLAGKVNSPVTELERKIETMLAHQKDLEKQIKSAQQREASNVASNLLEQVSTINGVPAIIHNLGSADGDFLQTVADSLKGRFKGVIVLGGVANNAVALVAAVSPEHTKKIQAGRLIQQVAPVVGGKGGGRPDNARGGGKDASKLDEALSKVRQLL